jgi:hypothetical protein
LQDLLDPFDIYQLPWILLTGGRSFVPYTAYVHTIQVSDPIDPVFGNEAGAAIHYKTMSWWHVGILMIAENISLGILALPQSVAVLGLLPGLLLTLVLGVLAGYTGFIIGQFKQAFPQVQSFADCGELIAGPIGREVMAVSQILILVFIMGAHVLSFSIAMNAMTEHGACTVLFSAVGLVVCFVLGLPRTLKNVSYLSIFCELTSPFQGEIRFANEIVKHVFP